MLSRGSQPGRAAVALVLVVVGGSGALAAAPAARAATRAPGSYSVTTVGAAVQVLSTQRPAFGVATADVVDSTLGLVSSGLDGSGSSARGASYYPGDLLAQAGQLICGQFGPCPFTPPPYPLLAEASWPTVGHATAGSGVAVASASATATSNAATAAAVGSLPAGLRIGSGGSTTTTQVRADGLHVHVDSAVSDVVLGPLRLSSVRVTDDVTLTPDGRRTDAPHVTATGATLLGRALDLGALPVPALAQRGLSVRLVGTDTGPGRSGATGLRLDLTQPVRGIGAPVPGLPSLDRSYVASVVLGQVSVVAAPDLSLTLPPSARPALPRNAPPLAPAVPVRPAVPVAAPALPAPGTQPAVVAPAPVLVVTRSLGLDDLDLSDLYAVLALATAVGLVTSRALSRRGWQDAAA